MKLDRWKSVAEIIAIAFGIISSLSLGVFMVLKHLGDKKEGRVKETESLVQQFSSSSVHENWIRITNVWFKHEQEALDLLGKQNLPPAQWATFVRDVVMNEGLEKDIFPVIDFFATLQICVRTKICDFETAKSFFERDAHSFFVLHYCVIDTIRKSRGDTTFAKELEDFVRSISPRMSDTECA